MFLLNHLFISTVRGALLRGRLVRELPYLFSLSSQLEPQII